MSYEQLIETNVFQLIARISSFNRKQELENAQMWFTREVDKLKEDNKPKLNTSIKMKPVNEELVLNDLIEAKFDN